MDEFKLSFEQLPNAVAILTKEVSELKCLLIEKSNEQPTKTDRWFNLNELCIYHPDKPSKPTVYGRVNACTIPVHKGGKRGRFLKPEIDNWLGQGRKKTLAETASEADTYLKRKGGNNE